MPPKKNTIQIHPVFILALVLVIYAGGVVMIKQYYQSTAAIVALGLIGIGTSWMISNYLSLKPLGNLLRQIKQHHAGVDPDIPLENRGRLTLEMTREFNRLNGEIVRYINKASSTRGKIKQCVWNQTKDLRIECKQLKKHALTDNLTGLPNRGYLDDYAEKLVEMARKSKTDLACIMVDVDNFKTVNDTFGHAVGDDVIVFTAEILNACIREKDFCARYGGDEFVLLLPECAQAMAQRVAERIRGHFMREVPNLIFDSIARLNQEGKGMQCVDIKEINPFIPSLSIGLAMLDSKQSADVAELRKMADTALYRAKESGRNCVIAI
ncbi:MAG: GGDEF domain-containing protein [Phycisphaerae bacterium]|nr:GGDEF domain-containing protein [Phycisphaerae bacterium]